MLLEFTVGNFLSFKEKKTFSLEAGSISEHKENVVKEGKYKVLRSAVIYGANSSGKSNFVKALEFMVNTIKNSSKLNSTDKLNVTPFLLNIKTQNEPSYFEIVYLRLGLRYRYGFEIDNEKVCSEWLYILENDSKKEDLYFVRSTEGIGVADIFYEARIFVDNTRNNGLFLSLLDQLNIKTSKDVMSSFTSIHIRSGIEHSESAFMTDTLYQRQDYQNDVKNFIYHLNLGFNRFHIDNDKEISFKNRFKTFHKLYNNNGNFISDFEFSLSKNESSGTNKIFDLAGYIVLALKFGSLVLIDELDSKLHPILTQEIIKLFNNPETNPKNAQLIFTTHDTNLLGANLFRRDQVWFTEKDDFEATDLYSLLEFKDEDGKTIRKDRSFEKDYIRGRYGAIPYITNFQEI
jgi:AAA15 family ATPase/GTPase